MKRNKRGKEEKGDCHFGDCLPVCMEMGVVCQTRLYCRHNNDDGARNLGSPSFHQLLSLVVVSWEGSARVGWWVILTEETDRQTGSGVSHLFSRFDTYSPSDLGLCRCGQFYYQPPTDGELVNCAKKERVASVTEEEVILWRGNIRTISNCKLMCLPKCVYINILAKHVIAIYILRVIILAIFYSI